MDIPLDFVSHTLEDLNISVNVSVNGDAFDPSVLDLPCSHIYVKWKQTMGILWSSTQFCFNDIYLARLCPERFCPNVSVIATDIDRSTYLGASTKKEKRALVWVSRASAMLTFLGASFILYDVLRCEANRVTVFHQLLVGMATCDIITAFSWVFASAPIDKVEACLLYTSPSPRD